MIRIPSWELIKKYDRPGPRYTSYPTAPEWTDDVRAGAVRGAPGPRRRETRAALHLRPPPVLPRDVPLLRLQRRGDPRSHPRRRLPRLSSRRRSRSSRRSSRTGARSRSSTGAAARRPSSTRSSSPAATRSSPATSSSRRTPRRRSRSTRPSPRKSQIETLAKLGLQPHLDGRAGLRPQGAGGGGPHPGREGDGRPRAGRPRQRLQGREPRPHLRPALPDAGDLEEHARADPRDPPRPAGGLRLRLRALVEAAPAAAARRRRCPRPSSGWSCSSPRWRPSPRPATGSSASTTSRSSRTSSPRRRTAGYLYPELPGLHGPPGRRHGRLRDELHLRHRRRLRPELPQAEGLGRRGRGRDDPGRARRRDDRTTT